MSTDVIVIYVFLSGCQVMRTANNSVVFELSLCACLKCLAIISPIANLKQTIVSSFFSLRIMRFQLHKRFQRLLSIAMIFFSV